MNNSELNDISKKAAEMARRAATMMFTSMTEEEVLKHCLAHGEFGLDTLVHGAEASSFEIEELRDYFQYDGEVPECRLVTCLAVAKRFKEKCTANA